MKTEEAIKDLEEYIEKDEIYQENKPESDFDRFCIKHCEDIKTLIEAYKEKEQNINNYLLNYTANSECIKKQVIRNKIDKIKERAALQGLFIDKEMSCRIDAKIQTLKELLGE